MGSLFRLFFVMLSIHLRLSQLFTYSVQNEASFKFKGKRIKCNQCIEGGECFDICQLKQFNDTK
jgi:hypothetical protein